MNGLCFLDLTFRFFIHNSFSMIMVAINEINKLANVPIKYFSAKSRFSNCLNRAILLAVRTKPIAEY